MMSAFTSWMIMTFMAFMQPAISRPMPDFIVTEYDVVVPVPVPVYKPIDTINCSECLSFMNSVKNETEVLENIVYEIEQVCGRIYGSAAHECVNAASDMEKTLAYLAGHNSTQLCKTLHYC